MNWEETGRGLRDGQLGEGGEDGWGGRERRVHCSYCLGRHTPQEECRAQEAVSANSCNHQNVLELAIKL